MSQRRDMGHPDFHPPQVAPAGHPEYSGGVGREDQRDAFEHLLETGNFAL